MLDFLVQHFFYTGSFWNFSPSFVEEEKSTPIGGYYFLYSLFVFQNDQFRI